MELSDSNNNMPDITNPIRHKVVGAASNYSESPEARYKKGHEL